MRHEKFYIVLLYAVFSILPAFSQDSVKCNSKYFDDDLLEKLVGSWTLTGNIGKRKVVNDFTAKWILNHQFMDLNFIDASRPVTYVARVSIGYDCISERYVMHWLDSFGGRYSETFGYGRKKKAFLIEFRFEYPDAPFINEFIYDQKHNSWHLHMTTKNEKDEWIVFGDEYLKRKK